jgi:hypothetical protein
MVQLGDIQDIGDGPGSTESHPGFTLRPDRGSRVMTFAFPTSADARAGHALADKLVELATGVTIPG